VDKPGIKLDSALAACLVIGYYLPIRTGRSLDSHEFIHGFDRIIDDLALSIQSLD